MRAVRLWNNTVVVTARLWENGAEDGGPFDKELGSADTSVRTKVGADMSSVSRRIVHASGRPPEGGQLATGWHG